MDALGIDGAPDGWIGVAVEEDEFHPIGPRKHIAELLNPVPNGVTALVDIPIGLPDEKHPRRKCDRQARTKLKPERHSSVFDPPVREVIKMDTREQASETQNELIGRGISVQSWGIRDKILDVDAFLRSSTNGSRPTLREAHPEVCYAALGDRPTQYSKTGQPAAAVWERVERQDKVMDNPASILRTLASDLDAAVSNHDLLDALVLALVASDRTGPIETLPPDPPSDAEGLRKEIVFARPRN